MKLGNLEIHWKQVAPPYAEPVKDLTAAFAVAELDPLWLGVHQALNKLEREMIEGAYNSIGERANDAIRNAEGVQLVRLRLIEIRNNALHAKKGVM
jgi:hypothetical protein